MTFKQATIVLALLFVIVLAVVVALQMSSEAMAVVIGIVCGVLAGIPTSVLLLVALTRRDLRTSQRGQQPPQMSAYPPVVVIQGAGTQALPPGMQSGYWPASAAHAGIDRQFHVVGGDDLVMDENPYWHTS